MSNSSCWAPYLRDFCVSATRLIPMNNGLPGPLGQFILWAPSTKIIIEVAYNCIFVLLSAPCILINDSETEYTAAVITEPKIL